MKRKKFKIFQKVVSIIAVVAILSTGIAAIQSASTKFVIPNGRNISVNIENPLDLTDEQVARIETDVLAYYLDDEIAETANHPYGLSCLFGHDKITHTVRVIEHKVYKTAPRCKESIYSVTTCSRCDYEEMTLLAQHYISCCPED